MTETALDWGEPRPILFGDGKRALAWQHSGADPICLRAALGLENGAPVLVVIGGAAELTGAQADRAEQMLGSAVPAAAEACGAAVVDGGTASGIMRIIGAARARQPGGPAGPGRRRAGRAGHLSRRCRGARRPRP